MSLWKVIKKSTSKMQLKAEAAGKFKVGQRRGVEGFGVKKVRRGRRGAAWKEH